ncbi:MAG: YggU family protein [Acidimicrobiales bacterium]|nr:YggU family protein [Acidimicrobiales bacterium]
MSSVYELDDDGGVLIAVHAQPGAGRSHVVGRHGDALKVRVAVPPVNDRANAAIAALLAEQFGVKDKDVALVSGGKSRQKRFRITGVDPEEVDRLIEAALDTGNSVPGRGVREPRPPTTQP